MPNVNRIISPYIPGGNPDTMAVPLASTTSLGYAPGQLGCSFDQNNNTYTLVNTNPGEAVAANQVLYWFNKATFTVTAAIGSAPNGRNGVAGIARVAITSGVNVNGCQIAMLVKGHAISVLADGSTFAAGDIVIPSATTNEAAALANGTAATYQIIGIANGASSGGTLTVSVDVQLDTLP